jgi:LacI family transcriptional regulator
MERFLAAKGGLRLSSTEGANRNGGHARGPAPPKEEKTGGRLVRPTIQQVAKAAGVSISTVSRAINGRSDVSPNTRLRVREVARLLGYEVPEEVLGPRQQTVPRDGRLRPNGIVGVTMPYSSPAYFATILGGVTEALGERGMRALVCPTKHRHDYEQSLLEDLARSYVNGAVLVLPEERPEELVALRAQGLVFVVIDPLHEAGAGIPVVAAANSSGAYQATSYLLELGHRRIAVITGPMHGSASKLRLQGFHAALVERGLAPDPSLIVEGDFTMEGGAKAAVKLMGSDELPTAIFALNDLMAVGAMQAVRERGLRVPEDVSVLGFDDTPEALAAYPALTTVQQPLKEMGRTAVSILSRLLSGDWVEPLRVELATRLVVRASAVQPPH